jgi:hypothetical protein
VCAGSIPSPPPADVSRETSSPSEPAGGSRKSTSGASAICATVAMFACSGVSVPTPLLWGCASAAAADW